MKSLLSAALIAAALSASPAFAASDVVTIYSASGLHDGKASWLQTQFDAFTKATGIEVHYVEADAAGIVERIEKQSDNPQADVLVTRPPYMQRAKADGVLREIDIEAATEIDGVDASYIPLVYDALCFVYDAAALKDPPATYDDLIDPKFAGKIQYSTPGETVDGDAVMLQVIHSFDGRDAGFAFLKKLQANRAGAPSSTAEFGELVDKGELYVASGEVQRSLAAMADHPNLRMFWPAGPNDERSAISLPYYIGLVARGPDIENGQKLIEFLLSQGAQQTVTSLANALPVRNDVFPTDDHYTKLTDAMKDVVVWRPDWIQEMKQLPTDLERWRQAAGR